MATERLSKLQKWILTTCMENAGIRYRDVFKYYGRLFSCKQVKSDALRMDGCERRDGKVLEDFRKEYPADTYYVKETHGYERWGGHSHYTEGYEFTSKEHTIITGSEKAVISRCLKLMVQRELLSLPPRGNNRYHLTESGCVKANMYSALLHVSFKEYQDTVQENERKEKERIDAIFAKS